VSHAAFPARPASAARRRSSARCGLRNASDAAANDWPALPAAAVARRRGGGGTATTRERRSCPGAAVRRVARAAERAANRRGERQKLFCSLAGTRSRRTPQTAWFRLSQAAREPSPRPAATVRRVAPAVERGGSTLLTTMAEAWLSRRRSRRRGGPAAPATQRSEQRPCPAPQFGALPGRRKAVRSA
jgi:hypothetical protein